MSGPFSNTHLRIPRGFGTILNGLVREVLRDQPEDIPKYAAQYFSSLLKQREESGMDPAEWAAGLEDRFYNNRFKDTEAPATRGMSATKTTTYKGNSIEFKTGEESCHSRKVSSFSTIQQDAFEGSDLTGGTKEHQEEKHDMTENFTPKDKLSEGELVNRELDADEPSGPVEQAPLRNLDSDNEKAIDRVDVDHPDSEFTGISGFSDDVACVSPPTAAEDDGSEKEGVLDKNIVDLNEKTEDEEQAEDFPHSGCPGVNVFEAKIEEKDNAMKGSAATGDRQEERDEKPQHKDTSLPLSESLKSEYERPEDNQRQAEDQAETTEELERLQTCSEETHDRFSNIEDSNTHKADLSVEVSFEGLPEAQEIKEFEDRQPEEQDAVEVLQTNREMLPVEESKEIASVAPDQNVSVTQDREYEVVGVELEANSEGKEVKSQQEASVMKERVDTNDPNLSDEKDKMGEGGKVVSSSYQLTGTPEGDNPEYENGHVHESSLKISKGKSQQKDPNSEAAETTDVQNGDEEHVSKQGICKVGAENQSPQASQSNSSTGAPEPETETLETSVHHLSEEDNGGQGTALKAEPEATVLEEGPPEPLELVEEQTYDLETQEDSRTSVKDSVSPDPPADEGEKGHPEKDTAGPEDSSGEKQEDCSRPQEEEDIMDIPLDDPEANRAAAKIQAGFRGHMTRKKLKPEDKAEGEERQEDRGQ